MTEPLPQKLATAFQQQRSACEQLGSPFTARICQTIAENGLPPSSVREMIATWPGDPSSNGDSVPLRLCGALHELVLSGADAHLAELYPPATDVLELSHIHSALAGAISRHEGRICKRLLNPPQTNEIGRAAAIHAGLLHIVTLIDKPLILSEIGASAGLNLLLDRFGFTLGETVSGAENSPVHLQPEWTGKAPPPADFMIADRRGCDLSPFDLAEENHRIRLLSYLWADQTDRLDRMRSALAIFDELPVKVDAADAVDWLDQRLSSTRPGHAHVVFHTIAWQYLSKGDQRRGKRIIQAAGARSTRDAPLFLLSMESDGRSPGAALRICAWPGGNVRELARVDFHARWIAWI
ncbi:DUF2332 domain-containing protein [Hoeflea sp. TYP-13]|uniref:DUF2332 domain-containing protein n=1 Tax=Hoeflea sp. TYP-13 TaxID=3230023 RepID=UPI0034C6C94C